MTGVPLSHRIARTEVQAAARRAVFHCVDGYRETIPLVELLKHEAFLVYSVNGEHVNKLGYPLRLAIPGKYGYKWAKWVQRLEFVADDRKGYWERRGLPERANVGDIW